MESYARLTFMRNGASGAFLKKKLANRPQGRKLEKATVDMTKKEGGNE